MKKTCKCSDIGFNDFKMTPIADKRAKQSRTQDTMLDTSEERVNKIRPTENELESSAFTKRIKQSSNNP